MPMRQALRLCSLHLTPMRQALRLYGLHLTPMRQALRRGALSAQRLDVEKGVRIWLSLYSGWS